LQQQFGERVAVTTGDAASAKDNASAVRATLERFGRLDAFVGNVGVWDYFKKLSRISAEQLPAAFDEAMRVNVLANMLGAQAALPALMESKGAMVFTASPAGRYAACGGVLYTAAKHALVGMVKQLAYECAPDVRVNAVSPGGSITQLRGLKALGQEARRLDEDPRTEQLVREASPLKRVNEPGDHASLYVLLASRRNAMAVTGEVFASDGGLGVR
jgi:NAD(P)-dependent dehydrogenase (short-subunit alcohol dehydrogenase family)